MAIIEIEPHGSSNAYAIEANIGQGLRLAAGGKIALPQTVETVPVEEETVSPVDLFKRNLHVNVIRIEDGGQSALAFLTGVMDDLRAQRTRMTRETISIDYELNSDPNPPDEVILQLCRLQGKLIDNYHMLKWAEGYRGDRI